jgi:hypothetical protein
LKRQYFFFLTSTVVGVKYLISDGAAMIKPPSFGYDAFQHMLLRTSRS